MNTSKERVDKTQESEHEPVYSPPFEWVGLTGAHKVREKNN